MPFNPEDISALFTLLGDAVKAGNFRYVAALLVIAGVFYGGKALAKKAPFWGTPKGKAVLSVTLAVLGGVATAFAAGHVPSFSEFSAAIGVALTASGGWSMFKAFFE